MADTLIAHNADVTISIHIRRPKEGDDGYIGAYTTYPPLEGETWQRGNDLPDGKWGAATLEEVIKAIREVFNEVRE